MIKGDAAGQQKRQPTDNNNNNYKEDPNFDRKLDTITADAQPFVKKHLLEKITRENSAIIVSYILAYRTEVNLEPKTRIETILKLKHLAEFHDPSSRIWQKRHEDEIRGLSKEQIFEIYKPKSFREMTREDVIEWLDRLRKPDSKDQTHKWIGTYNNNRQYLMGFFKWLYYPDIDFRNRPVPAVIQNIPKIKRKEKDEDIYKESDVWTHEDDMLFCKYCTSLRDRAYWMVARDTGCRRGEMVKIKIKDLRIEKKQKGEQTVTIRVNGKTGSGTVRVYRSYSFLRKWLQVPIHYLTFLTLLCSVVRVGKILVEHSRKTASQKHLVTTKKFTFPNSSAILLSQRKTNEKLRSC